MRQRFFLIAALIAVLGAAGVAAVLTVNTPRDVPPTAVSTQADTPAPPSTPETARFTLQADAGSTFIALTWPPIEGAAAYQIYRDGSEQPLNAEPLLTLGYQDIGLTNGRIYQYQVIAVNAAGEVIAQSELIEAVPASTSRP
jgi:fibronectin type 3 domain-containing protein